MNLNLITSIKKHFGRRIALTVMFVLFAAINSVYSQDIAEESDDVIRIDTSLVILNVSVKDREDKYVRGLNQNDFTVLEDGKKQEISFFSEEDTPFAAVILIDSSGSMEHTLDMARAAAIKFLDGLRADDNVAIYRFDSKVSLIQDFSNSRDISYSIFGIKSYGQTSMYDAVYKASQVLSERPEKRRAIIILSDGADNFSGRSSDKALKAAMDVNAGIYSIDMASEAARSSSVMMNRSVLRGFSEKSGGTFVSTPGGVRMRDALEAIVEELGVQYTLGYSPVNDKKDGKWRNIKIDVARQGLKLRTRKGYTISKIKN